MRASFIFRRFRIFEDWTCCRRASVTREWWSSERLSNLTAFNLDNGEITDDGFKSLAELKQLTELSLDNTHVTDKSVAVLRGLPQLKRLNMYHTFLTSRGAIRIEVGAARLRDHLGQGIEPAESPEELKSCGFCY